MNSQDLVGVQDLENYFFEQIRRVLAKHHFEPDPHTEFYLVKLLSNFCFQKKHPEKFSHSDTPLAIQYLKSLQDNEENRFRNLKALADFLLCMAGFFQDNLNRRELNLDYYVSLGGTAYLRLHHLSHRLHTPAAYREIFLDLSDNFIRFVDILSEMSENSRIAKNSDLLKTYEKWLATGSEQLLKKLHRFGIYPESGNYTQSQH